MLFVGLQNVRFSITCHCTSIVLVLAYPILLKHSDGSDCERGIISLYTIKNLKIMLNKH